VSALQALAFGHRVAHGGNELHAPDAVLEMRPRNVLRGAAWITESASDAQAAEGRVSRAADAEALRLFREATTAPVGGTAGK